MPPEANQPVYVMAPAPSNGLGQAGFIVSLVGWFTLGLLCPIGLILSFFGLFRRPRGFATAGVILGLVGSIVFVIIGLVLTVAVTAAVFSGSALYMALNDPEQFELAADMTEIVTAAESYRSDNHVPPPSLTTLGLDPDALKDPWDSPYEYVLKNDSRCGFDVISRGPDHRLGSEDDITLTSLDQLFSNYIQVNKTKLGNGGRMEIKIGSRTIELLADEKGSTITIHAGDKVIRLNGTSGGQGSLKVRSADGSSKFELADATVRSVEPEPNDAASQPAGAAAPASAPAATEPVVEADSAESMD